MYHSTLKDQSMLLIGGVIHNCEQQIAFLRIVNEGDPLAVGSFLWWTRHLHCQDALRPPQKRTHRQRITFIHDAQKCSLLFTVVDNPPYALLSRAP